MQEKVHDQRTYLKVKIKSLAEEAKIIRREERKASKKAKDSCGYNPLLSGLQGHRIGVVRSEARHTLLAYGFLRQVPYSKIEATAHTAPDWSKVWRMVEKYGVRIPSSYSFSKEHGFRSEYQKKLSAEEKERFEKWKSETIN